METAEYSTKQGGGVGWNAGDRGCQGYNGEVGGALLKERKKTEIYEFGGGNKNNKFGGGRWVIFA